MSRQTSVESQCWLLRHGRLSSPFMDAHEEVGWLIELVTAVRSVRAEMNVPAASLIPIEFVNPSDTTRRERELWDRYVQPAREDFGKYFATKCSLAQFKSSWAAKSSRCRLPASSISPPSARGSPRKWPRPTPISRASTPSSAIANFVARAPEEVVEEEKEKREEALARKAKIAEALERLKGAA